jgi:hypothetical protein
MITLAELNRLYPHAQEINHSIHHYWELFCNSKYEECVNCTYPGIFKTFPKKKMVKAMEQAFHNPALTMSADIAEIDSISKIIETDRGAYCAIDYTLLMALQFTEDLVSPDEHDLEKKREKKKFLLAAFEAQYGKDNIWHDEITKSYCFYLKNKIIAIKDNEYPEWSFITFNEHPFVREFIPNEVFIILEL